MQTPDTELCRALNEPSFHPNDRERMLAPESSAHPRRILILYGSLRPRRFSRLAAVEAGRILTRLGAKVRFFNPSGMPLPDQPGAMTGIKKAQIDWIPPSLGAVRPTQGKTLAVMQVSGGSQSFSAVDQMHILGRWMRLIAIPNQSSIPKACQEFDEVGRTRPSQVYDRIVDVVEELMKFTLLTRDRADYLVDRYSERMETAGALMKRVNLSAAA